MSYQLLGMGADAGTVGLVTSAYALLPLIFVMWLGRLAERTPRLSILMLVGAVVFAGSCLLLMNAQTVFMVAVGSVILGVAHIIFTIAGQASIARHMPPGELDRGFGWFTAGYAVGQLVGPLLGGLMLGSGTDPDERAAAIRTAMFVGMIVALAVLPVISPLVFGLMPAAAIDALEPGSQLNPEQDSGAGTVARGEDRPTFVRIVRLPSIPSHMVASLALLTMADLLIAFLPVVGERHGVAPVWIGIFLAVRAAATIASRICLPWLSARYRRSDLVIVSLLGAGITIVATPSTLTWPVVTIILMAVGGFFLGLGQPLTMTLVVHSVPATWRSTALAVRLMGNRLGQVVVPVAAGGIAWAVGPAGAIWFASLLLVVSGAEKSLHRRKGGFRR